MREAHAQQIPALRGVSMRIAGKLIMPINMSIPVRHNMNLSLAEKRIAQLRFI